MQTDWIEIGKIVSTQGLKGEVRVYPDSDFPERFLEPGPRWLLHPGEPEPKPVELVAGRYLNGKGLYVLRFAHVQNREQAEALRDCRLMVPESDRPPLEEGEFHVLDLIGLEVFHQPSQTLIGQITDVLPAGNDLLEVELIAALLEPTEPGKKSAPTVLVPFVEAIVPVVDLAAGRVEITPPAGLIEGLKINQEAPQQPD